MKNISLVIVILSSLCSSHLLAQETIDGSFEFLDDPAKKYSIYIPSGYDEAEENALMVGLHPFNTNRWDAESWRDTLIAFAEQNQLILACPDGGIDGKIDDPIDTSFTSAIIDSIELWYNIDQNHKYLMGFSWGGKTVYSYGLRRTEEFAGFMPIGAAISGLAEIEDLAPNAKNENWYLVHGSIDSPNTRYFPAVAALEAAEACLETNLLSWVAHTIDFPDRNQILTDAYQFLSTNVCSPTNTSTQATEDFYISPNPNAGVFTIQYDSDEYEIIGLRGIDGMGIPYLVQGKQVTVQNEFKGLAYILLDSADGMKAVKLLLL